VGGPSSTHSSSKKFRKGFQRWLYAERGDSTLPELFDLLMLSPQDARDAREVVHDGDDEVATSKSLLA